MAVVGVRRSMTKMERDLAKHMAIAAEQRIAAALSLSTATSFEVTLPVSAPLGSDFATIAPNGVFVTLTVDALHNRPGTSFAVTMPPLPTIPTSYDEIITAQRAPPVVVHNVSTPLATRRREQQQTGNRSAMTPPPGASQQPHVNSSGQLPSVPTAPISGGLAQKLRRASSAAFAPSDASVLSVRPAASNAIRAAGQSIARRARRVSTAFMMGGEGDVDGLRARASGRGSCTAKPFALPLSRASPRTSPLATTPLSSPRGQRSPQELAAAGVVLGDDGRWRNAKFGIGGRNAMELSRMQFQWKNLGQDTFFIREWSSQRVDELERCARIGLHQYGHAFAPNFLQLTEATNAMRELAALPGIGGCVGAAALCYWPDETFDISKAGYDWTGAPIGTIVTAPTPCPMCISCIPCLAPTTLVWEGEEDTGRLVGTISTPWLQDCFFHPWKRSAGQMRNSDGKLIYRIVLDYMQVRFMSYAQPPACSFLRLLTCTPFLPARGVRRSVWS